MGHSSHFPCLSANSYSTWEKPGSSHLPRTLPVVQLHAHWLQECQPGFLTDSTHFPSHWVSAFPSARPSHLQCSQFLPFQLEFHLGIPQLLSGWGLHTLSLTLSAVYALGLTSVWFHVSPCTVSCRTVPLPPNALWSTCSSLPPSPELWMLFPEHHKGITQYVPFQTSFFLWALASVAGQHVPSSCLQ